MSERYDTLVNTIDTLGNLSYALKMSLSDATSVEKLRDLLPQLVTHMKAAFVEATGEDPWLEWEELYNHIQQYEPPIYEDESFNQPIDDVQPKFRFNVGETVIYQYENEFPLESMIVVRRYTATNVRDNSIQKLYRCRPDWKNGGSGRYMNYFESDLSEPDDDY